MCVHVYMCSFTKFHKFVDKKTAHCYQMDDQISLALKRTLGSRLVVVPQHSSELRLALLLCWQLVSSSETWRKELVRHGVARMILEHVMVAQGFLERDLWDLSVSVLASVTESLDDTENLWDWGACVQIADHLQRHPRRLCPEVFRWLCALLRDGDVGDRVDTLVSYGILGPLVFHACENDESYAGRCLETVLRIRPELLDVGDEKARKFAKSIE